MIIKLTEQQYKWLSGAKDIIKRNKINEIKHIAKKNDSLHEDVFVNGIKGKKANLTYNKRRSDSQTRNIGNLNSADMLDTIDILPPLK